MIGTSWPRNLKRGVAVGAAALTGMGGVAWAAIPDANGTIKGCYARTSGLLLGIPHSKGDVRVVDSAEGCRSYETAISWNQKGPQGPQGPAGPAGPQGAAGAPASRLWALWTDSDILLGPGGIKQQSGGITSAPLEDDKPFVGFQKVVLTFPQDVSACVAVVSRAVRNGIFVGAGSLHPLSTMISGSTVSVFAETPPSNALPGFAIAVHC